MYLLNIYIYIYIYNSNHIFFYSNHIYLEKKITRITFILRKKNNSNHIYIFKSNLDLSIDQFMSKLKTTHTHGFLTR